VLIRDLVGLFTAGPWRQRRALAAGDVERPQEALVDRDRLADQQLVVARRPVEHRPAATLDLSEQAVGLRITGVDDVEVVVGAGAARGRVREPRAAS
jgi:hypothetical protein